MCFSQLKVYKSQPKVSQINMNDTNGSELVIRHSAKAAASEFPASRLSNQNCEKAHVKNLNEVQNIRTKQFFVLLI